MRVKEGRTGKIKNLRIISKGLIRKILNKERK